MPDGSIPGRDSGRPPPVDCSDEAMATFTVRVVQGPVPVAPAVGAPVRMEHRCGAFVEGTTGPDGTATLTLAGARGDRFDVTAWQPGYTAVSIVGLEESPVGDLRLDPLSSPPPMTHAISGFVRGSSPMADGILLDSYGFNTVNLTASGKFATQYYEEVPEFPVQLVAIETTRGRATNFALGIEILPRPTTDVEGLDVMFPATPAVVNTTTWQVQFPPSMMAMHLASTETVVRWHPATDLGFVYAGISTVTTIPGGYQLTIDSFDELVPSAAGVTFDVYDSSGGGVRMNMFIPDPGAGDGTVAVHEIMVSPIAVGGRLDALEFGAIGSLEWDAIVLHIGEDSVTNPPWRVFCVGGPDPARPLRTCHVPHLPSRGSASMILPPAAPVLPMLIEMQAGTAPWSTRALNGPAQQYHYTGGGSYGMVETAGR
jgi:hypothetical protein